MVTIGCCLNVEDGRVPLRADLLRFVVGLSGGCLLDDNVRLFFLGMRADDWLFSRIVRMSVYEF